MGKRSWRRWVTYVLAAVAGLIVLAAIAVPVTTDCSLKPEDAAAPAGGAALRTGQAALPDGGRVHYDEAGQGPAVLLIHGTGGGTAIWGETFAALAAGHRVISYDRRGFGDSSPMPASDDYFHQHGEDAAALIASLGIAPVTVIGHSAGGIVSLDLAAHHPELVARLILMEPPYRVKEHVTPAFALTFARLSLVRPFRGEACAASVFLRFASRRTDGVAAFDEAPRSLQDALLRSSAAILNELDAGTGEQLGEETLRGIRVPAVLFQGSLSPAIFLDSTERVRALVPGAAVRTIPGAGHMMQGDAPQAFTQEVLTALAQ